MILRSYILSDPTSSDTRSYAPPLSAVEADHKLSAKVGYTIFDQDKKYPG